MDHAQALGTEIDRVVVIGREWHWLPTRGMGRSVLDVTAIERVLGRGTTRTVGTLLRLLGRVGAV